MQNIPQAKIHTFTKNMMTFGNRYNLVGYNKNSPMAAVYETSSAVSTFKIPAAQHNEVAADFHSNIGCSIM